jgi:hypothetical protein
VTEKPQAEGDSAAVAEDSVLPQVSEDERNEGWGRDENGRRDAEWYRRERPPHHE